MKVLVTGSDGYIGSVLMEELLKRGIEADGLDTCFYKNSTLGTYKKHTIYKQDIRNLHINLSKYDAIIHLAALSNDPISEIDPELTKEINHHSTLALAKKAKKSGVKRFIFSSSCSIFGISKTPVVDENSPVKPLTTYARSKVLSERALKKLADKNFCVCLLRNSTVFGYSPKFRDDLVVNNLTTCGFALKKILIKSDGTPWRPLVDVRDLTNIFIEFLFQDSRKINGKIINVGFNNSNLQVNDVLRIIKDKLKDCEVIYTGEHGSDTRSYKVSFNKFKSIFPKVKQDWPLEKSVEDLIYKLKKFNFTKHQLDSEKFTRLEVLKKLITDKKINKNLYWRT